MTADLAQQNIQFITGKLAEHIVRATVAETANHFGFRYSVDVLPITVAALMTPKFLRRHLRQRPDATMIMVPGYLQPHTAEIQDLASIPVVVGPREIRELPWFFSEKGSDTRHDDTYDIEVIAEINHANRLTTAQVIEQAEQLRRSGADVIDLGDSPEEQWPELRVQVRELVDRGMRVSIDSFAPARIEQAVQAGCSLVLSVNSYNRQYAPHWGCEVVVIPDEPNDEKTFLESIEFLGNKDVPMRLDPILEPIGCGFVSSLKRYMATRRRFPEMPMMMGIGNITELTDVDSAGVNMLLLGICQELDIRSVLTTQVINWARTSVRECDIARRIVRFACRQRVPPKNVDTRLVMLRDPRLTELDAEQVEQLARSIRDRNVRILVAEQQIHVLCEGHHWQGTDPFELMQHLLDSNAGEKISPGHAFYLGYEMCKAELALQLGKNYRQDEALQWGLLTRPERHRRLK